MSGYKCARCGLSSLVRSNFRLTRDGRPYCRKQECADAFRAEEEKS